MELIGKFVCSWLTISSCYGSVLLTIVLIDRNSAFNTLYHILVFDYQEKLLKTFPGPGFPRSEDWVV